MEMPIRTSFTRPSLQLTNELSRLAQIAAGAKVLGNNNLYTQAETAYNKLVDTYNASLPPFKPKGFWPQLKANVTFTDLDRNYSISLEHLSESSEYSTFYNLFLNWNRSELIQLIRELANRRY